jgi:CRISPR-associated protein Csd1
MLLGLLYDFARSRGLLEDLAFAPKAIRWVIPLNASGELIGNGPQETGGDKTRGKEFLAPQTSRPKNAGGVAEFLADNITGVFGLDLEPDKDKDNKRRRGERDANNEAKRKDFWRQIGEASVETGHPALSALLRFRQSAGERPSFLRWGVGREQKSGDKSAWWLTTAAGEEVRLGPDNLTFQVDGELLLEDEGKIRPYWRGAYKKEVEVKDASAQRGICLITGNEDEPIAPTHLPKVRGVPNTQSFGAAIVSFDKPAFASYGFDQSHNAPSSTAAVSAYCNALNFLLANSDHSLRIGQTSICFWARDTKEAASFFARMLNRPDPAGVAEFLKSPWVGIDRELARHDQFYSVTLSGNAGRIIVRHWMQTTLEAARGNLRDWFADLEITPFGSPRVGERRKGKARSGEAGTDGAGGMPPLALFRLACSTVREAKDLQAETLTQLYRASLEGTAPSLALLGPILDRLATDLTKNGGVTLLNPSRFALMRLILNRNQKRGEIMIQPQVFETGDTAYNCGRLLAIFDDLQMKAHDYRLEGPGVVERYYGSASSAPNSAFGILWRLHQHHLRKVSRRGDKGRAAAEAIKDKIAEIAGLFPQPAPLQPPQFPRAFSLQEQGRFALGFYQQKAADDAARRGHRADHNSQGVSDHQEGETR